MQRKKLLAASIAAAIAPMTAQAVDVSVSGQVNRMIRYADDGHDSDIQHIDHAGAGVSRWRMSAEGELDNGLMAGAYIESAFGSNANTRTAMNDGGKNEEKHKATTTVTEDENGVHTATTKVSADSNDDTRLRHSYVWLSGNFGKLTLGHTGPSRRRHDVDIAQRRHHGNGVLLGRCIEHSDVAHLQR